MKRRDFLRAAGCLPAALALPAFAEVGGAAWRSFELIYDIDLKGEGPAQLWLPLPQSAGDYQRALDVAWSGDAATAEVVRDAAAGAPIFHASWSAGGGPRRLRLTARAATRDRATDLAAPPRQPAADPLAADYLRASPSMPTDGIVQDTARDIVRGLRAPEDKAHAIYEWIVDNTFRDPKVLGCGSGDIVSMLETGNLGGKCADINSLFVGLARAAGIPAREVYGVRVADSRQFKSLGKSGDVSRAQHCRAEAYLLPWGWVPVDPADVRKAVLEEKLPLSDPKIVALRRRLFGAWEMNWLGFNSGRDIALPGTERPIAFLMYPNDEVDGRRNDGLRPDAFDYRLTAREFGAG